MGATAESKPGRPAPASRDEVFQAVRQQYLSGTRVDLTVVARSLGLGRATIYRWFGSRERLLGLVIADEFEALVTRKRGQVRLRGGRGVLEVCDQINRSLVRSTALRRFLEQEQAGAMRLLTSSAGVVQSRAVASITALIAAETRTGRYEPAADPETLAYAIVRLAEAFLYNDAVTGIRGDHTRLREVQAALLGVPPQTRPPRRRTPRA